MKRYGGKTIHSLRPYCGWLGAWALLLVHIVFSAGCAGRRAPVDLFVERQEKKIQEKSTYIQADFDFWAAFYEPTSEDVEELRAAWVTHGQAFPESKTVADLEKELRNSNQKVVLISLFATEYENADLKDKALGWAVHPVPKAVKELSETDVVLRAFMPVRNRWARYFLLIYPPEIWSSAPEVVISNRTSRVQFRK